MQTRGLLLPVGYLMILSTASAVRETSIALSRMLRGFVRPKYALGAEHSLQHTGVVSMACESRIRTWITTASVRLETDGQGTSRTIDNLPVAITAADVKL